MAKIKTEREKKLQKKLIPLNIVVCIIALVAAITLFLTPILKIDFGKIMRDKGVMEYADENIDKVLEEQLKDEDQTVDFKPVVAKIVKNVLGGAEGEVSVSAFSSFKVLIGSGDKAEIVMDELFFGDGALITNLINSIVDNVANLFETDEGKKVIEDATVLAFANALYKDMDTDGTNSAKFTDEKVQGLTEIIRELGDVTDGNVDTVANKFVDEVAVILGEDVPISAENRQEIVDEIQKIYDSTVENLKDGETVSVESIICVAVSENIDLSTLKIDDLLGNILGKDEDNKDGENTGSVHISPVDGEVTNPDSEEGGNTEGSGSGGGSVEGGDTEGGGSEGGSTEGGGSTVPEGQKIVTNYTDLLAELGFGEEEKEDLKIKLRTTLNDKVNEFVDDGIGSYIEYYQYLCLGMLAFIVPWLILFLFAFFHLFAKNKRFTMWYVKLFCWIPPLIWLVLTLFPVLAPKISFLNDIWNGEQGKLIQGAFAGIGTFTWISGICYVLLWLVSICWAFPIKHKIRKERKQPEVVDAEDDEEF